MTDISHDSFSITREIRASRKNVFAAWAKPDLKRRWFVDSDGPEWTTRHYEVDFRVGGHERGTWLKQPEDGGTGNEHSNETVYLDIVNEERVVFAYTMAVDGTIHSASLVTVTLEDDGEKTRLKYTEQGTYLGDSDGAESRKNGWEYILNQLEKTLA